MSRPLTIFEIRLFAQTRELAGVPHVPLRLPEGSDVASLKARLGEEHPNLAELLQRSAIAVNHRYAEDHTIIAAGDEIAVIPPVAGG